MSNATNFETKHLKVGDVSYAYRELRPTKLADPTSVVFLHRFRGTLDDWDPAFVDELAKTRHVILFSDAAGHAPHQQHPTEVAAQVDRFLSLSARGTIGA